VSKDLGMEAVCTMWHSRPRCSHSNRDGLIFCADTLAEDPMLSNMDVDVTRSVRAEHRSRIL
jgi:hypothetical protein